MKSEYKKEHLTNFYRLMYKARRFDEEVFDCYKKGLMPGLAHLCLGQEAISAGACTCARKGDYLSVHHRGHGHFIARGSDMKRMFAEILGRKNGYCKGKGGSQHLVDMENEILGSNGILGASMPIATGAAYMSKVKQSRQVVLCFIGDGASNEGTFHESLNMASAWKLPIVYIIENNLYGISTDIRKITNVKDLSVRANAYGIKGITIDGNDVIKVHQTVKEAVEFSREGGGPTLIECKTYRAKGHHVGDPATYRIKEEEEMWKTKCPIAAFKARLIKDNIASEEEIIEIERIADKEIDEAKDYAINSPYPAAEEAFDDVYCN